MKENFIYFMAFCAALVTAILIFERRNRAILKLKEEKPAAQGSYSKLIVSLIVILNIAFTVAILWVFKATATEPTTLIVSWFAFTTGELWLTASIKKTKVKKEKENPKDE